MSVFARVRGSRNETRFALVEGDRVRLLSGAPWAGGVLTKEEESRGDVSLLTPVVPSKIICVGRNYRAHAAELGHEVPSEPLLFFKPPSSLVGPGEAIVLPPQSQRVDHEAELGVVIGRRCRGVRPEEAGEVIFGFTCVNDVTARDLQKKDGQWARAKGFDTFCPVGPVIVAGLDAQDLRVEGRVNGSLRQGAPVSDMIFGLAHLVSYISEIFTLEPGDLIATGTPEGVGPLAAGDVVEVSIEGIGALSNPVRGVGSRG